MFEQTPMDCFDDFDDREYLKELEQRRKAIEQLREEEDRLEAESAAGGGTGTAGSTAVTKKKSVSNYRPVPPNQKGKRWKHKSTLLKQQAMMAAQQKLAMDMLMRKRTTSGRQLMWEMVYEGYKTGTISEHTGYTRQYINRVKRRVREGKV